MNTLDQLDTAISDLRTAVATCVPSPQQEYLQSLIERLIGPAAELREQFAQDMVLIPRSVVLEFKALAESSHRISALVAVLEAWPVEEQKDDARVDSQR